MTGTLFTIGYAAKNAHTRLADLMSEDDTTMLIDIRFKPYSQRYPEYNAGVLAGKWKRRYWQLGWSLGNLNYNNDGPILLARPEHGIRHICEWLRSGINVILLCACADESRCHRTIVAQMVQAALAESEVQG